MCKCDRLLCVYAVCELTARGNGGPEYLISNQLQNQAALFGVKCTPSEPLGGSSGASEESNQLTIFYTEQKHTVINVVDLGREGKKYLQKHIIFKLNIPLHNSYYYV